MKILYISNAVGADYLCDMIFHGLRSLFGPDLVDVNKIHFMYQGTPYPPFFSIYGLLPNIDVDRSDVVGKIRNHYFDAVVYGSIQRCKDYWGEVSAAYPPSKIAFLDGEDDNIILHDFRNRGFYFKRELQYPDADLLPIGFCIPKEKILTFGLTEKTRLWSPLNPHDRGTYVYYGNEASYYEQYAISHFGRTVKKGGWDCCRHYEIMGAGCMPYFERLEECPPHTLQFLPKVELLRARWICDTWNDGQHREELGDLSLSVQSTLREKLTTEAMAKYVIERVA